MFTTKNETSDTISSVVEESCAVICSTMSPKGKYVNISQSGLPMVTKDGTTVAKSLQYKDRAKDLVVQQIAQATVRTDEICGDGTTTTAFIIEKVYKGFKNDLSFKRRKLIEAMTESTVGLIHKLASKVTLDDAKLYDTLLTTANHDETIVEKVIEIAKQCETFPRFVLIGGNEDGDVYSINQNITYRANFADPSFSANGQGTKMTFREFIPVVYENTVDLSIKDTEQVKETLDLFYKRTSGSENTPCLIFARTYSKETLDVFRELNKRSPAKVYPIQIAGMGSSGAALMKDISTLLNVPLVTGLSYDQDRMVGRSNFEITIATGALGLIPNSHDDLERVHNAKKQVLEHFKSLSLDVQRSALGQIIYNRYEILATAVATVYVGGVVDTDISERKARYEDVYKVARSSLRNGVIAGCGNTLAQISEMIKELYKTEDDHQTVARFAHILTLQARALLEYGDETPVSEFVYVNLATGEEGPDAESIHVYDAAMATATAISAGVKTALLLINTSSIVTGNRLGSVSF